MKLDRTWAAVMDPGRARIDRYFAPPGGEGAKRPPFDPEALAFTRGNAWWLAEIARLVYNRRARPGDGSPAAIAAGLSRAEGLAQGNLREVAFYERRRIQAGLFASMASGKAPGSRFAVLCFRGTDEILDWVTNFRSWRGAENVHVGFSAALDGIWPEMDAALRDVDQPLFLAGHSLGGALATLAFARLADHPQRRAAYTIGAPRVGGRAFAARLEGQPLHRIVHARDIVPRLPPPFLGYRHVGSLLAFPDDPDSPALPFGPPRSISDHAPINYVMRLGEGEPGVV